MRFGGYIAVFNGIDDIPYLTPHILHPTLPIGIQAKVRIATPTIPLMGF
ncbi:MAG: hypothetical protein MJA27_14605 [Pseudanabaenales cyanobacterium]|nr:hypothetical protein [Pseudanabaenales cyanobacterium]